MICAPFRTPLACVMMAGFTPETGREKRQKKEYLHFHLLFAAQLLLRWHWRRKLHIAMRSMRAWLCNKSVGMVTSLTLLSCLAIQCYESTIKICRTRPSPNCTMHFLVFLPLVTHSAATAVANLGGVSNHVRKGSPICARFYFSPVQTVEGKQLQYLIFFFPFSFPSSRLASSQSFFP